MLGVAIRAIAALGLAAGLLSLPAAADDRATCDGRGEPDPIIAACSRLIAAGRMRNAGITYNNRGFAYLGKGSNDPAIADFNEAIRLSPHHYSYQGRGMAYLRKGDHDRAIADATVAIRMSPKYAIAYTVRAHAHQAKGNYDSAIADFDAAIKLDPKDARAIGDRGQAYNEKGDTARALADFNEAIRVDPSFLRPYSNRAFLHFGRGEYDQAIADFNEYIKRDQKWAGAYYGRGQAHASKGDHDRAIADFTEAVRIDAKFTVAYRNRGKSRLEKGDYGGAISDYDQAIRLAPNVSLNFRERGIAHHLSGDHDRALIDLDQAIRLSPKDVRAHAARAAAFQSKGLTEQARADYRAAVGLSARTADERLVQQTAQERLARLEAQQRPADEATESVKSLAPARRVALVIGNSVYEHAAVLRNARNDARDIAAALRRLGFTDVIERYNLNLKQLADELKRFGDAVAEADWAVVYYAGHGIEVSGANYLLPVDVRLERASHIADEALPLDRVLSKIDQARQLRLVILDACRNNPFATRMAAAGGARSIGRGLGPIEPTGGVLVAYSARHGQVALDGDGENSPFAQALLDAFDQPRLEIGLLFRHVRDAVLARTGNEQEPFTYGSLPRTAYFFRP